MDSLQAALLRAPAQDPLVHRPVILRLNDPADRKYMEDLLRREPCTEVLDRLHAQLRELVRTLNPSVQFTSEALDLAAKEHLKGQDPLTYGVWVHYPWSHRLIHLLDEAEFVQVRTDRNRNKITREEQALLATKKVGVIGLSVGQSVCLTMAMERSFGELRIADFDTLDLSNLNRIRSGVHEMGLPKVMNTAREIAELDPFLKVVVYPAGITRANIDPFLTDGGKLDVLVEECDSVDVKIHARLRAKAFGIPVIMDTSDRGLIDVERYDLEPERPLVHGRLTGMDVDSINAETPAAIRLDVMLNMVGKETLSTRMKASFPEIGHSLITWPQLGGHVVMGGAMAAELWRKMAIGEMDHSGRWYVDLEEAFSVDRSTVKSMRSTY